MERDWKREGDAMDCEIVCMWGWGCRCVDVEERLCVCGCGGANVWM